jgi:hypothetical protein
MSDDTFSNSDSSSTDSETTDTHLVQGDHDHPFTSIEAIQEHDWSDFDRRKAECRLTKPYADPKILSYSYWIEGLSQAQIGERYNVTGRAIGYQMDKHGVPTEAHPNYFRATLTYAHESAEGGTYDWIWSFCNGERYDAYGHHLVACVEHDPYEVFCDGTEIHHETGHPLDNRPDALSVVEDSEHPKPNSRDSKWIIEDGEPRLRMNPETETPNPVEEWWADVGDDEDVDDYGLSHGNSTGADSDSDLASGSGSTEGERGVVDAD